MRGAGEFLYEEVSPYPSELFYTYNFLFSTTKSATSNSKAKEQYKYLMMPKLADF